jgi:tRNA pseudouridine38-40 synthase
MDAASGADDRRNVRLTVAYDGSRFHGVAVSRDVPTVLDELQRSLAVVVRADVHLTVAGRTDAGVHAWGQVASGRLPAGVDLVRVRQSVNRMCGPAISVRSIEWAPDDFDARRSATSRTYRYEVWNDPAPHPLLASTTWHVPRAIDLDVAAREAHAVVGEHDFAAFCRAVKLSDDDVADGRVPPSTVRIVLAAAWSRVDGPRVRFEITATSFCHQMVRSIVGTLVDVGTGRRPPGTVAAALAARSRSAAGTVAPPTGLVLWDVGYDGTRWDA